MGNNPTFMRLWPTEFKQGSVVLVQGASSGVGREMTYRYAARGCPVVISGRNQVALEKVVAHCAKEFGNVDIHYFIADCQIEE